MHRKSKFMFLMFFVSVLLIAGCGEKQDKYCKEVDGGFIRHKQYVIIDGGLVHYSEIDSEMYQSLKKWFIPYETLESMGHSLDRYDKCPQKTGLSGYQASYIPPDGNYGGGILAVFQSDVVSWNESYRLVYAVNVYDNEESAIAGMSSKERYLRPEDEKPSKKKLGEDMAYAVKQYESFVGITHHLLVRDNNKVYSITERVVEDEETIVFDIAEILLEIGKNK